MSPHRPHVRTANGLSAPVAQAMDKIATPVCLLEADGTVTFANPAALRLEPSEGIWIEGGRLRSHDIPDLGFLPATAEHPLRSANGTSALALFAAAGDGCRVVRIVRTIKETPTDISADFALTGAEREIAEALAKGQRPEQIAAARGRSLHTVRSQIRAIYAKTDARRQSDLIRLATARAALADIPDPETDA